MAVKPKDRSGYDSGMIHLAWGRDKVTRSRRPSSSDLVMKARILLGSGEYTLIDPAESARRKSWTCLPIPPFKLQETHLRRAILIEKKALEGTSLVAADSEAIDRTLSLSNIPLVKAVQILAFEGMEKRNFPVAIHRVFVESAVSAFQSYYSKQPIMGSKL